MANTRKKTVSKKKFTVSAGREILRNGLPFISIGREGQTRPTEADALTHAIAAFLNRRSSR